MKRFILIWITILSASSLVACNTVQGLGKDIEKSGQAIGKAAS